MDHPTRSHRHDDRGVVALELVLVLPIIIGLLVASITLAGLFQTKSRVVGAARDGARALALGLPNPDVSSTDGITVVLVRPACPPRTDPAYQSSSPPRVIARAFTTYDVTIPFVGEWTNIDVSERATMPCG